MKKGKTKRKRKPSRLKKSAHQIKLESGNNARFKKDIVGQKMKAKT